MARTTDPEVARALRLKRKRERQAIIYTFIITLLVIIAIMAAAILTGRIASPFDRDFSYPPVEYADLAQPCISSANATPLAASDLHVNVYNASGRTGLARRTADYLNERNINILVVTDAPSKAQRPAIHFGVQGLDAAHTLRAHVPGAVLVLDKREGVVLDLVLGSEFEGLRSAEHVNLDNSAPLPDLRGCVPVDDITPTPAPVNVQLITPPPTTPIEELPGDDDDFTEDELEEDVPPEDQP